MSAVTIMKCAAWGEYRVPSLKGPRDEAGAYYTDSKEDATDTAHAIHGSDATIKFRSVSEWPYYVNE